MALFDRSKPETLVGMYFRPFVYGGADYSPPELILTAEMKRGKVRLTTVKCENGEYYELRGNDLITPYSK